MGGTDPTWLAPQNNPPSIQSGKKVVKEDERENVCIFISILETNSHCLSHNFLPFRSFWKGFFSIQSALLSLHLMQNVFFPLTSLLFCSSVPLLCRFELGNADDGQNKLLEQHTPRPRGREIHLRSSDRKEKKKFFGIEKWRKPKPTPPLFEWTWS